ncbi:hypothetical protein ACSTS3_06140 [Aquimarina muelleri]
MKKIYQWIVKNPLRYAFIVATLFLGIYVVDLVFFNGFIEILDGFERP